VIVLDADGGSRETYLDIDERIDSGGERGLLGLAFHPDFASNGRVFVNYTDLSGNTVVSEFAGDAGSADPDSERILLGIQQPFPNHNGGDIAFGPDGYLHIAMGDGGSGGDPLGNGQSLRTLLGKMLRIDVDGSEPYGVPADNPFVGRDQAMPEIWAYGLRNPWRFSFDRATGDLWIGDVGQYIIEEIDVIGLRRSTGANFGWRRLEGSRQFSGSPPPNAVAPIHEYAHGNGRCAVIGGHVYRGTQIRGLQGAYVYSDVCDGRIRALARARGKPVRHRDLGLRIPGLVSFAENRAGELYALSLAGGVYRLASAG
jgi:glucose/arabinose dehydrogenase